MLAESNLKAIYRAYIIPFSSDESYSLIFIYLPESENFVKALFITKSLESGEELKNILKLDKNQFSEEKALEIFEYTVKDMFNREILKIDPGAKLIELKFENPKDIENNLKAVKKALKELELL
jgi:hypothetical protein